MRPLLHQLENNEAILLMYLAGELPEQDRAEVEQMLASDPGLRAELDRLARAQDEFHDTMQRLDAASPVLPAQAAAVRRVGVAIAQWHIDGARRAEPAAEAAASRPWRAYGTAAAAVVALGLLAWWGKRPSGPPRGPGEAFPSYVGVNPSDEEDAYVAANPILQLESDGEAPAASAVDQLSDPFDAMERELFAVSNLEARSITFFGEGAEAETDAPDDF